MSSDDVFFYFQGVGGFGLAFIAFIYNFVTLCKRFTDPDADGWKFYDVVLQTFGMPIAIFLFAPTLLMMGLMASPIWVPIVIRSWYMRKRRTHL